MNKGWNRPSRFLYLRNAVLGLEWPEWRDFNFDDCHQWVRAEFLLLWACVNGFSLSFKIRSALGAP